MTSNIKTKQIKEEKIKVEKITIEPWPHGSGATVSLEITNNSNNKILDVAIKFRSNFQIRGLPKDIWDARIINKTSEGDAYVYVIKFPDHKRHLSPGEKRSFGFNTRNPSPEFEYIDYDSQIDPGHRFRYGEALQKSFLFYEANRSGPLPPDNRIEWRSDSTVNDGADVGRDLTGGYFDAGDHVKFGFPMAASITTLSWGVLAYKDAYQNSGQLDEALKAIKWGTDYFLKAHITENGKTKEFYGQVGHSKTDHDCWGSPENMPPSMYRPSYKIDRDHPGSDLAAETAAALAAASILFRPSNTAYANTLLNNAKQLYEFADKYRGKYSDSITDVKGLYESNDDLEDELAWGAIWLYKATKKSDYLKKAEDYYPGLGGWTYNWNDKSYGTAVLLAQETNNHKYRQNFEDWLDKYWINGEYPVHITKGGLAWLSEWGSLRYAANTAFLAGVYYDTVRKDARYDKFAREQIDYILGDNPRNSGYVVGFGNNYPQQPHHRGSHDGSWSTFHVDEPNKHILYGALVGGLKAAYDCSYQDLRSDFRTNEVATDYNAAFTGVLARMYGKFGGEPLSGAEWNDLIGVKDWMC